MSHRWSILRWWRQAALWLQLVVIEVSLAALFSTHCQVRTFLRHWMRCTRLLTKKSSKWSWTKPTLASMAITLWSISKLCRRTLTLTVASTTSQSAKSVRCKWIRTVSIKSVCIQTPTKTTCMKPHWQVAPNQASSGMLMVWQIIRRRKFGRVWVRKSLSSRDIKRHTHSTSTSVTLLISLPPLTKSINKKIAQFAPFTCQRCLFHATQAHSIGNSRARGCDRA